MSYPHSNWRLIRHDAAPGAWNMAVDEALMESIASGLSAPLLRLYAWEPACLSIGYAQPASDVAPERLAQSHWDLVRRPTGGRAILHADELTYALIAPSSDPRLAGGVLEGYRRISQALLEALHRLDAPAQSNPSRDEATPPGGAVCFEMPSNYEITVDGKKLIGSAQVRRRGAILQHGSLPLSGDLTRIIDVLAFPGNPARTRAKDRLLRRATTLEGALGRPIPWDMAADALIAAFTDVFNLTLSTASLTPAERSRVQELERTRYGHRDWTERV